MVLSPLDIQQKTFRVALRGYAEEEVDEFLDEIVVSIREYEQRLADTDERVKVLEAQLSAGREAEDALRRTFVAAQRTADQIAEEARREAEKILSDARADASRLSIETGREKNQMLDELERLRGIVADVRERLADIAGDMTGRIGRAGEEIEETIDQFGRWEEPTEARAMQEALGEARTPTLDELVGERQMGTDYGEEEEEEPVAADLPGGRWVEEREETETPSDEEDEYDEYEGDYEDEYDGEDEEGEEDYDDEEDVVVDTEPDTDQLAETRSTRRPWERYDD